jgi:hypothetical protein
MVLVVLEDCEVGMADEPRGCPSRVDCVFAATQSQEEEIRALNHPHGAPIYELEVKPLRKLSSLGSR